MKLQVLKRKKQGAHNLSKKWSWNSLIIVSMEFKIVWQLNAIHNRNWTTTISFTFLILIAEQKWQILSNFLF
jgi:hypothetical protein